MHRFHTNTLRHGLHAPHLRATVLPLGTEGADTITSGSAADLLDGRGGVDHLYGGAGAHTLLGGEGNDLLVGGTGIDRMVGGAGDDVYSVDVMGDVVMEAWNSGIDTVRTAAFVYGLSPNVENLIGTAALFGQNLFGNDLANVITGTALGDHLAGMGGNDTLKGGLGDDIYYVETTGDGVIEAAGAGYDTVFTDLATYTAPANVDEVEATTSSGQKLTGNGLDNFLGGMGGNDSLMGGDGRDGFAGVGGNDVLTGGAGVDYFEFLFAPLGAGNVDTITDFNAAVEELDLQRNGAGLFNTLSATGWLDPTAFKMIGMSEDANDRILYNKSTGQVFYDADGNGGGAMVQFAVLSNHAALTAANIWVFDQ
ncbi:MAG: calcium-binding protein [Pseudorhodobacter sp.]|nr:calcium-binding protein [Pseudorhodobacter sp.]